jgi:hypothetical protein
MPPTMQEKKDDSEGKNEDSTELFHNGTVKLQTETVKRTKKKLEVTQLYSATVIAK